MPERTVSIIQQNRAKLSQGDENELVRDEEGSLKESVWKIVYVCHQFASDPSEHLAAIREVCHLLVGEGCLPLAPQLFLPQFLDEISERDRAMSFCMRLVALVDELRVYGKPTEGMRLEIAEARRHGIPIVEGNLP